MLVAPANLSMDFRLLFWQDILLREILTDAWCSSMTRSFGEPRKSRLTNFLPGTHQPAVMQTVYFVPLVAWPSDIQFWEETDVIGHPKIVSQERSRSACADEIIRPAWRIGRVSTLKRSRGSPPLTQQRKILAREIIFWGEARSN